MTPPRPRPRTARPAALMVAFALLAVTGNLLEAAGADKLSGSEGGVLERALVSGAFLGVVGCGALILSRRPKAPTGRLLVALALSWAAQGALVGVAAVGLQHRWTGAATVAWVTAVGAPVAAALLGRLVITFPDGTPSPFWRRLGQLQVGAAAASCAGFLLQNGQLAGAFTIRNPHAAPALGRLPDALAAGGLAALFLTDLVAVGGIFRRLRRAAGVERQQLKAFCVPLTAAVLGLLLLVFGPSSTTDQIAGVVFGLAVVGLAIAATVSVLRYRLYAIDIVLERGALLLGLATVASLAYLGTVLVLRLALRTGPGGYGYGLLATVAPALVLLAAYHWVLRLARRLVYGVRATPYEALSRYSRQLAGAVSLEELLPATAQAAAVGLGAAAGHVEVSLAGGQQRHVSWPASGADLAPTVSVPVRHGDTVIGTISVSLPAGDRLDATRQQLLADLGSQAALALRNARLTADLEASVTEVRASRERLVAVQDAERRKVERDLHDGAQQRLLQLGLSLQLAQMALARGDSDAVALLTQSQTELRQAQAELRELARGIHPAVLTEAGLAAALESLAGRATLPVTVSAHCPRLPAAVESTAYFLAAEALTNVAKHARASHAHIRVTHRDGVLHLEICDDGGGGADERRGSGLVGLRDRIGALGGRLAITSQPRQGTTLRAEIPCALS
ncbi:MAG: hypothetical protein NVS3B26_11090 [Mycobacteriales bacterium]